MGQVQQNCLKVSDLVKLPLLIFIEQHLWGLALCTTWDFSTADSPSLSEMWAEENSGLSLALPTFFCSFTGLSYPFFYIENLAFLVRVSRNAEKSDFFFPTKTYICGFISQMTEDLEMGPVLLRMISELQLSVPPKAPSHTTSLLPLLQTVL